MESTTFDNRKLIYVAINGISSLPAILTNIIVFISIWRTPRLHTPSFVLIFNLAVSDFGVGLIVQPIFIAFVVFDYNDVFRKAFQVCCMYFVGASTICMAAIAVDRCLAVMLHMRYQAIVTTTRAVNLTLFGWVLNTLLLVFFGLIDWETFHYVSVFIVLFCVILVVVCYYKIFRIVRKHRRQIMDQRQAIHAPAVKHGKSLKNMFYLHGFYALSFVPLVVNFCLSSIQSHYPYDFFDTAVTFAMLNSTVNPFLYFWRMKELRRAVFKVWKEKAMACSDIFL